MNQAVALPDALTMPLADIDVSDPRLLEQDAATAGFSVGTTVSTTVTDPWTFHVGRPTDAR